MPESSRLTARLLGPARFTCGGEEVELPGSQLPQVLALLVLGDGRPVPMDTLVEHLWPDRSGTPTIRMAQNLLSRLQTALSAVGHGGLSVKKRMITLPDADSDAAFLEVLVSEARSAQSAGDPATALATYDRALDLVNGDPLESFDGPVFTHHALLLSHLIEQSRTGRMEVLLETGDYRLALDAAHSLLVDDPLSQHATKAYMVSRYHLGDVRAASEAYMQFQKRLADELGLDPSSDLQETYTKILRGEPLAADATVKAATTEAIPHELPPPPANFVGRGIETDRIDRILRENSRAEQPTVVAINGVGGVGKSALAVHAAHRAVELFPDGQLYINLHGATPDAEPVEPGLALQRFLRSLGRRSDERYLNLEFDNRLDVEEISARFRTATSGKKILVVLDDAQDAKQIRPLIPSGSGCAVVITSRLAVTSVDNAVPIALQVLEEDSAMDLLAESTGHREIGERSGLLREIASYCGGLPLALCILSARIRTSSPVALPELLNSLRTESDRLDEFADDERCFATSLAVSIRDLESSEAGRSAVDLFRSIGLHEGTDFSVEAAAAMVARSSGEVRRRLRLLETARLVVRTEPRRFHMHDLVKLFARRLSEELPVALRREVVDRLRCFYLQSARLAHRIHDVKAVDREICGEDFDSVRAPLTTKEEAYEWLARELSNIRDLSRRALKPPFANPEFAGHLCLLAIDPLLETYSRLSDLVPLAETAANAVVEPHRPWHIHAHLSLSELHLQFMKFDTAEVHSEAAMKSAEAVGSLRQVMMVRSYKARLAMVSGDYSRAMSVIHRVIPQVRRLGFLDLEAWQHVFKSLILDSRGFIDAAVESSTESVELAKKQGMATDNEYRFCAILNNHGFRLLRTDRWAEAHDVFADVFSILGNRGQTRSNIYAEALVGMGKVYEAGNRRSEARECWRSAADIARTLGMIDEDQWEMVVESDARNIDSLITSRNIDAWRERVRKRQLKKSDQRGERPGPPVTK